MIVRTLSQLPEITKDSLKDNDLVQVSWACDDKYQSRRLQVGELESKFTLDISSAIGSAFDLYQEDMTEENEMKPIAVRRLSSAVNDLYNEDVKISGIKTFNDIPRIPATAVYPTDPELVPNVKRVKALIEDDSLFVGPNYMVDADPGTDNKPATTVYSSEFMYWRIDDMGNDSTQWMNPDFNNKQTELNGVECQHTGYLTIFGWLADNGNVKADNAWVGLFGKVMVRDTDSQSQELNSKWILLQMQPWTIGSKSSERQYVQFSLPVKAGLRLKIKTGFPVNGNTGGFSGYGNAALALNQPNAFVGYILRSQD